MTLYNVFSARGRRHRRDGGDLDEIMASGSKAMTSTISRVSDVHGSEPMATQRMRLRSMPAPSRGSLMPFDAMPNDGGDLGQLLWLRRQLEEGCI